MTPQINHPAPFFTMYNTAKQEVSLENLRGKKVVLLFFPAAFTGTCTTEMCSMRDQLATFNSLNAEVFGISVDTVFTQAVFKEKEKLNFELLCDFNKIVIRAYDVYHENFAMGMIGVAKRAAFVIDENGIIRHIEVCPNLGDLPDFEKIKQALI